MRRVVHYEGCTDDAHAQCVGSKLKPQISANIMTYTAVTYHSSIIYMMNRKNRGYEV